MRKISVLLATLGLVIAGTLFPVASAQASAACDTAWHNAIPGAFYAYDSANCANRLGSDSGADANWGDSAGSFRGSDTNKANSILHKGTSGLAVRVSNGASYTGNYGCIKKSEFYVSQLYGDYLTGGTGSHPAWNSISSHKWVRESACGTSFLH